MQQMVLSVVVRVEFSKWTYCFICSLLWNR